MIGHPRLALDLRTATRHHATMLIYKIFRLPEWRALEAEGQTQGAPVDLADGYIHFSTADQVIETAARHFEGQTDLMLAAINANGLGEALRWEVSRGGAPFPHLYRPLRRDDVLWARPLPFWGGGHVFPEPVAGHIDPERAQFDIFKALDRDHPVEMLNLVRLRTKAAYPEGHALYDAGLSGAAAYARYGASTAPLVARIGAAIVWRGMFEATLIGPEHEQWDHVFVARYPSAHAFLEMITDPAYRAAVQHRQAAVRTSRLIRCHPCDPGGQFA